MRRASRRLLALALLGALIVLWPGGAAAAPTASIAVTSVAVEDGQVRFLVTPHAMPRGSQVAPADLRVAVDGQQLDVRTVRSEATKGVPARGMIVVVDASNQVSNADFATATAAALRAVDDLPPDVWVGLVAVQATPKVVLAPTQDRKAYTHAVETVQRAGQAAALLDSVIAADKAFDPLVFDAGSERRLLVLTTGRDTGSTSTPQTARTVAAVIDTVGLRYSPSFAAGDMADLRTLVEATGGREVLADSSKQVDETARTPSFPPILEVRAVVPASLAGANARIDVSVPDRQLTASVNVVFAGTSAARGGDIGRSYAWVPGWVVWVVGALLFAAIVVGLLAALWPRSAKYDRIKQIENFGPGRAAKKQQPEASTGSMIARTALAATASVVGSGQMETRVTQRLERAGMRMRAAEWVLLRVCITVALGALLFVAGDLPGGVIGVIIGWLSTMLYQTIRIDRRMAAFSDQLPDSLQLMIGSLRSGFSLPQALDSLVREAPEPVAAEFGRAMAEHRLGADVSDALERVAQRAHSEDLGWAVMAVRIQREVGGNLAEVLQTTVDTMRERARLRRHVLSLSAEGRISAWVLIGLPIVLALFMFFYRRDYMIPLVTDPLGITMLAAGGLLFVIGIFWMTRVIKVEP